MTIPQRILLHVAAGAALVIAVATAVTYGIIYDAAKQRDLKHLETYVTERARREEIGFKQVEINLNLVRGQFLKRMEGPLPRNIETQWNERFELFPDGSWRSKTNYVDGRKYSTLWAHKNVVFTPELKTEILRAQNICDELLPGWVDEFPSVYFVFPGWLNIGFDPRIPAWVWDTPANYDATNLEWFDLAMPKQPTEGRFGWTGVIEEPTTKVPIVSAYLPIFKDGKFLGSLGHDKYVNRMMDEITRSDLPGARHVIFRADGRIIGHPTKLKEILASKGLLQMQNSGEPDLVSLYQAITTRKERSFSDYDAGSGCYYSVARLAGPEWFFLTTMPRELLQKQAFQSAQWVLWSGLISLALVLAFLAATLQRQIAQPLVELTRATKQMSAGDVSARATVNRSDELGELAGAFNEMAGRVAQRDAELQAEKASLERRVVERTAELSESEARFVTAFRHSPAMQSLIRGSDRVLIEVNDTFLSKLGFTREQVIGKSAPELDFWVDPAELAAFAQEVESRGFVLGREVRLRAHDGRVLTVLLSTQPVDIGGMPHFLSAGVDITARKESEARFNAAFHNSPVIQSVIRFPSAQIVEVNDTFMKVMGYSREEVIGKTPFDLNFWIDTQKVQEYRARLFAEGFVRDYEMQIRPRNGSLRTILLSSQMVDIQGEPHSITAAVDITLLRAAEAELQSALAKERELSQLKSNFVSLVSHEFRTPLEIIMSSVDNLHRYHDRLAVAKREQLLLSINRAVKRMSGMMEEVLVLGRLETDRMTFKPAPLEVRSFCQRICDEIASVTGNRCPIKLEVNGATELANGDEGLLRHILTNLLSNAVKYSPAGSPVSFHVHRAGKIAICRITDRGCGIPEVDQKRLFQAFYRGSNVEQIPGTGLGLLIVQRCVELHGGEIRYESVEGKGTTFVVAITLFPETMEPSL
ncbi:MAG: PAS domain S-box protein [Verrucomicrobiota bacterium]